MHSASDSSSSIQNQQEFPAGSAVSMRLPYLMAGLRRIGHYFKVAWLWLAYIIGSFFLVSLILVLVFWQTLAAPLESNSASSRTISGDAPDKVAILPLYGEIGGSSSPVSSSGGITYNDIDTMLTSAASDESVKAVVLDVDSPGGSAVISEQIYQRIKQFQKATHKPVIASFADTAASGGYYLSTAADKIVANRGTITGSIGVILEYYTASGLLDKVGVKSEVIKSGQYKDIGSPNRDTLPDERAIFQSIVDDAYDQFVTRVSEGRHLDKATVIKLADGRVYSGAQAKANGLVAELGDRTAAIDLAKQLAHLQDTTVIEYTQGGWLEQLLVGTSARLALLNPLAEITPRQSTSLQYLWRP